MAAKQKPVAVSAAEEDELVIEIPSRTGSSGVADLLALAKLRDILGERKGPILIRITPSVMPIESNTKIKG